MRMLRREADACFACMWARMDFPHTRRTTRLTNALFSKTLKNDAHAMALHFLYYNFARIH
jgi:hypothetical protein